VKSLILLLNCKVYLINFGQPKLCIKIKNNNKTTSRTMQQANVIMLPTSSSKAMEYINNTWPNGDKKNIS